MVTDTSPYGETRTAVASSKQERKPSKQKLELPAAANPTTKRKATAPVCACWTNRATTTKTLWTRPQKREQQARGDSNPTQHPPRSDHGQSDANANQLAAQLCKADRELAPPSATLVLLKQTKIESTADSGITHAFHPATPQPRATSS